MNGPRFRNDYPDGEHDLPKNIILLCKVHHKQVDDQVETFTSMIIVKLSFNLLRGVVSNLDS